MTQADISKSAMAMPTSQEYRVKTQEFELVTQNFPEILSFSVLCQYDMLSMFKQPLGNPRPFASIHELVQRGVEQQDRPKCVFCTRL